MTKAKTADAAAIAVAAVVVTLATVLSAQSLRVQLVRRGDVVVARADGSGVIDGTALSRLRDGSSIRLELELSVRTSQAGRAIAAGRQVFALSYDLWEERFAATLRGQPARSITHLTAAGVEAWCVEQVGLPNQALKAHSGGLFVRIDYRLVDEDDAALRRRSGTLLEGLVERLGRRGAAGEWRGTVHAGPLRVE